jgi:hypothetical protein
MISTAAFDPWWHHPREDAVDQSRFGIEPLHYHFDARAPRFRLAGATSPRQGALARSLPAGLAEYLTYCYTPGTRHCSMVLRGVRTAPPLSSGSGRP